MKLHTHGGRATLGSGFDAKVRCQTRDRKDLFFGHIVGINALAPVLLKAGAIIQVYIVDQMKRAR